MKRWNLVAPVPYEHHGESKTKWLQLGVMFENRSGTGFNMILDATPASVDGKIKIMAFPPDERGDDDRGRQQAKQAEQDLEDDDIPF